MPPAQQIARRTLMKNGMHDVSRVSERVMSPFSDSSHFEVVLKQHYRSKCTFKHATEAA
jgi:hypothetical protein